MANTPEARSLPDPPTDGITELSYVPKKESLSTLLASSSWDGSVRIHDTAAKNAVLSHMMESGPLLSLATPEGMDAVVTGGLDGSVRMLDIPSTSMKVVGRHKNSNSSDSTSNCCSCLGSLNDGMLASASWNSQFHLWDVRQSAAVSTLDLPGKAFSMDVDAKNQRVVVVTSGRRTCVIDVRKSSIVVDRESSLKYQTRTVKFFPDGEGIALGSIEGRVAVEFLEELGLPPKMKKYAFKCHRVNDTVYPVNCIEFHPRHGTFATGGCDGTVVMWDGLHKKKLATLPKFSTSISAMAFNGDGSELAIAASYTFEDGEREHPKDEIFIRTLQDSEVLPRNAK